MGSRKTTVLDPALVVGLAGLAIGLSGTALAQPQGSQVVRGNATITTSGSVTSIRVANNTILRHASFDIASGKTVQFIQPSVDSRVLNRISGGAPTRIDGTLLANGRVYLVNPAGVFFGGGAVINASAFLAAAGKMSDRDFLRGVDRFTDLTGEVINAGKIEAGDVLLAGAHVSNAGLIRADRSAILVSGDNVLVRQQGTSSVYVKVGSVKDGVFGAALGGARSARGANRLGSGDVLGHQLAVGGTVFARDIHAESAGSTLVTGSLIATDSAGALGGTIRALGERVTLDRATLSATGTHAGGMILVGGDYQGQGTTRTSEHTHVSAGSRIDASATLLGDGGRVVLWSEQHTVFDGEILARAGDVRGDGGFVEVSGKSTLQYNGVTRAGAKNGKAGLLLLDPKNITISSTGTNSLANLAFGNNAGGNSTVLTTLIASTLDAGTSVTLQANNDITLANSLAASGGTEATLTLQAGRSIAFSTGASLSLSNHNLSLIANDSVGVTGAGTQVNRDAGAGGLDLGTISTSGRVSLLVRPSSGVFAAGTVSLGNITANQCIINAAGTSVSQKSGSSLIAQDLLLSSPTGSSTSFLLSRDSNLVEDIATSINGSLTFSNTGNLRLDSVAGINGITSTGVTSLTVRGTVTQTQPLIAPTVLITTLLNGVGNAIILGSVDNNVGSIALDSFQANGIDISVRAVTYRDVDGVNIDGVNTAGVFTLNTVGEITQTLPIFASAGLFVTTRNNSGARILLDTQANTSNNVGLQVLNSAGNATASADARYRSLGALVLSDSRTGATLDLTAGGSITGGNGSTIIANLLRATTLSNTGAPITFAESVNTVSAIDLRSRNGANSADAPGTITYLSPTSLSVAGLRTVGLASLTVNGNLSQSGSIAAGVLTIDTLTNAAATINLLNEQNDVGTLNIATRSLANPDNLVSADIRFRDANSMTLGTIRSLGSARFTQGSTGTSTQSGELRLAGLALENGSWTLAGLSNTITTLAGTSLTNLNFENLQAINVGTVSSVNGIQGTGFVRLVARGAITQSSPIVCDHLIARSLAGGGGGGGGGAAVDLTGSNNVSRVTLESRDSANTVFAGGAISFTDNDGFAVLRLGTTSTARFNSNGVVTQVGSNSPIIAGGLVIAGGSFGEFTFDRTDNAFPLLAGNARSANVFTTTPLTITTLGGFTGINGVDFLRFISNGPITQNAPITTNLLVARTLNDFGAQIVLEYLSNNAASLNIQTRNAANTAFSNGIISYADATGLSVVGLGTSSNASLIVGGAVDQAGAVAPITASGIQLIGPSTFTLDNPLNSIGTLSGSAGSINLFTSTPLAIGALFSTQGVATSSFLRVQARGDITQSRPITTPLLVARTLSDAFTQVLLNNPSNNVNQINMQSRNDGNTSFGAGRIVYADTNGFSIVSLGTNEQAVLRADAGEVNQVGASLPITLGVGLRLFGSASFLLTNQNNAIPALVGGAGNTSIFTTTPLFITQLGSTSGFQSTGDVSLVARGSITQDRFIRGVNLFAQTRNNAGADIILITPGNDFTGVVLQARNAADTQSVQATLQYEEN